MMHYSMADYLRFATREQLRREALLLTMKIRHEQIRRAKKGFELISPSKIIVLYQELFNKKISIGEIVYDIGWRDGLDRLSSSSSQPSGSIKKKMFVRRPSQARPICARAA
jgi:hypothetical protein